MAGPESLTLTSSHPLSYLHDSDDGRQIQAGETVYGSIDFPGDIDYFVLDLSYGETVKVRKTSVVFDSVLNIRPLDGNGRIVFDSKGTGIVHRSGSSTFYQAPETGSHIASVNRSSWYAPGGYVLEIEAADPEVVLTQAARDSRPEEPDATPSSVPDSTEDPSPEGLTPAQILDMVSPSIVSVETGARSGSGVLIEDGYVVANAQVVWPFDRVRVVFPGGPEFIEVPVKGIDLLADLAVIGPIDTPVGGLELVDGESLPDESATFVIGYSADPGGLREPRLLPGVLHHVIDFGNTGISDLRVGTGGERSQVGWVVVSESGDVIGVLGQHYEQGLLDLAASSSDILPRARQAHRRRGSVATR